MSFTVFYLVHPSHACHENGLFLARKARHLTHNKTPDFTSPTPRYICVCAMQQHFLFSCVIKGGITKTPFPTCQNPAKKSSTALHRNGVGDLTEFSFRSLRTQSALRLRGGILYIVSPALSREESCHLHNNRYFKRFFFLIMPQNILWALFGGQRARNII